MDAPGTGAYDGAGDGWTSVTGAVAARWAAASWPGVATLMFVGCGAAGGGGMGAGVATGAADDAAAALEMVTTVAVTMGGEEKVAGTAEGRHGGGDMAW